MLQLFWRPATADNGKEEAEMIAKVLNVAEVLAAKINHRTPPAYRYVDVPEEKSLIVTKNILFFDF